MANSPADQNSAPDSNPAASQQTQPEAAASGFPATEIDENAADGNDWWPESSDGQCSENAALFAASQPAPLSIV